MRCLQVWAGQDNQVLCFYCQYVLYVLREYLEGKWILSIHCGDRNYFLILSFAKSKCAGVGYCLHQQCVKLEISYNADEQN